MNDRLARNLHWPYAAGLVATLLIAISVFYWILCWGSPTVVLLVRHAERQDGTDALAIPTGTARAQELAHVLEKSGISAIYTSQATRTQQTAAPTAGLLGITPANLAATDVAGLVSAIRTNHLGQKVLVVGHSDTLPQIIAEFGGPAVTIGANEYDNFYVLTLCRCRWERVRLANLQYGAPSP